jgi:hypothetical protein
LAPQLGIFAAGLIEEGAASFGRFFQRRVEELFGSLPEIPLHPPLLSLETSESGSRCNAMKSSSVFGVILNEIAVGKRYFMGWQADCERERLFSIAVNDQWRIMRAILCP